MNQLFSRKIRVKALGEIDLKKTVIILCLMIVFVHFPSYAKTNNNPPEKSTEELYSDIFVSLLMPHIEKEVHEFYSNSLTEQPMIYPYMIDIVKIKRIGEYRSFDFLLSLRLHLVIGPHITVGEDVIVFRVKGGGNVELKEYKHIKDYELPNHWKHILKESRKGFNASP
jgi:hypothetical protein